MAREDVAAVSQLVATCYRFLAERQGFSSPQLKRLLTERCSEEWIRKTTALGETYIAESGAGIVGLVGIEGNDIAELWVAPRCHRGGIGRQLFSTVERILRDRRQAVLTVHTTGYAIPFYEAMGAHVVGKRACDCGPLKGWTLTYLEKELKTEANTTSDVIVANRAETSR